MDSDMRATASASRATSREASAVPLPLPFDDESETPIPFVLTAAAQRGVLGRELPPLSVVPAATEPVDTRPVQARALLRSGMPVATIAAALGVGEATVEGWTEDLVDELARRRRQAASRRSASPRALKATGGPVTVPLDEGHRSRVLAGLAFALTQVDEHGVTILHDRVDTVAVLLDGLRSELPGITDRMRIALRVGTELPADRTGADVAERLGFERESIVIGRGGVGSGAQVEIRVDVRDPDAARLVRTWRDGSLGDSGDSGDPGGSGAVSGLRGWDSNPQTFRLTADCSAN